jgi:hypothetical protein
MRGQDVLDLCAAAQAQQRPLIGQEVDDPLWRHLAFEQESHDGSAVSKKSVRVAGQTGNVRTLPKTQLLKQLRSRQKGVAFSGEVERHEQRWDVCSRAGAGANERFRKL